MGRQHGTQHSAGRGLTFSPRAWAKVQAAQARFAAEAFALGQTDAARGLPARINRSPSYYAGYAAREVAA